MKRMRNLTAFLLIAALMFAVTGCKKAEPQKEAEFYTVTLADFETFDDIYNVRDVVSNMSFLGYFTRTTDKDVVIDGQGSLDVYIEGTVSETWSGYAKDSGLPAFLYYDLWSNTKNGGDWGFEWKYLSGYAIDVFNPNDFDIAVTMFMLTRDYFPYNNGAEVIPAKSKKTLHVNVNRYFMQNEFSRKLSYVSLLVDYDKSVLENGDLYYRPAHVYFDNLVAEVNENSIYNADGSLIVDKTYQNGEEILNFNDSGDIRFMREIAAGYALESENQWNTYTWFTGLGSSVSYNANPYYVHDGNTGSLKWTVMPTDLKRYHAANYDYNVSRNFTYEPLLTGITVCSEYLNYYNFSQLQSGQYKIVADIYNAAKYDKEVFFGIHDRGGIAKESKNEYPYNYGAKGYKDEIYRLKSGEWTTVEITDFSHLKMENGLARLHLLTSLIDVNEDISFYVNNLRIVRI